MTRVRLDDHLETHRMDAGDTTIAEVSTVGGGYGRPRIRESESTVVGGYDRQRIR